MKTIIIELFLYLQLNYLGSSYLYLLSVIKFADIMVKKLCKNARIKNTVFFFHIIS